MKNETELKQTFIKEYHKLRPNAHIVPIESNLTHQGIPDLSICDDGQEFWIEFKFGKGVLRPLQIAWKVQHQRAGGNVYVITGK